MGEGKLQREMIILHLYHFRYDDPNDVRHPEGISWKGIGENLAISGGRVTKILQSLIEENIVEEKRGITESSNRSKKIYYLLQAGKEEAKKIREEVGKKKVEYFNKERKKMTYDFFTLKEKKFPDKSISMAMLWSRSEFKENHFVISYDRVYDHFESIHFPKKGITYPISVEHESKPSLIFLDNFLGDIKDRCEAFRSEFIERNWEIYKRCFKRFLENDSIIDIRESEALTILADLLNVPENKRNNFEFDTAKIVGDFFLKKQNFDYAKNCYEYAQKIEPCEEIENRIELCDTQISNSFSKKIEPERQE